MKKSATEIGEQDFPVKWFKLIYPSSTPRMAETSIHKPAHVAFSPIASMNHQWTINPHDGYPHLHVLLPEEYIPPSLPTLCNLKFAMFDLVLTYSNLPQNLNMIFQVSLHLRWQGSFSSSSLFKSPTSGTSCFGDPILAKHDQVKLF